MKELDSILSIEERKIVISELFGLTEEEAAEYRSVADEFGSVVEGYILGKKDMLDVSVETIKKMGIEPDSSSALVLLLMMLNIVSVINPSLYKARHRNNGLE